MFPRVLTKFCFSIEKKGNLQHSYVVYVYSVGAYKIDILHPCMIPSFIPAFRHPVPSFHDSVVYRPPITPVVMSLKANILICHAFRFNERKHRNMERKSTKILQPLCE